MGSIFLENPRVIVYLRTYVKVDQYLFWTGYRRQTCPEQEKLLSHPVLIYDKRKRNISLKQNNKYGVWTECLSNSKTQTNNISTSTIHGTWPLYSGCFINAKLYSKIDSHQQFLIVANISADSYRSALMKSMYPGSSFPCSFAGYAPETDNPSLNNCNKSKSG